MANTVAPPDRYHEDPVIKRTLDWLRGLVPTLNSRIGDLELPPYARLTRTTAQSIANNVTTEFLSFDTVRWDTGSLFNVGNPTRLTAPTDGLYAFGALVQWAIAAGGRRQLALRINGSLIPAVAEQPAVSTTVAGQQFIATEYQLGAGDYVEVRCFQSSGAALNVDKATAFSPEFWMRRVGSLT